LDVVGLKKLFSEKILLALFRLPKKEYKKKIMVLFFRGQKSGKKPGFSYRSSELCKRGSKMKRALFSGLLGHPPTKLGLILLDFTPFE